MVSRRGHRRVSPTLGLLILLVLLAVQLSPTATGSGPEASTATQSQRFAANGFGDSQNSYSWSMAWFKGKLYVGTARNQLCVEGATIDFYKPGTGYKQRPAADSSCPADRYDLDLRAEIWQYTPGSGSWLRVYQSPADIPNPRAPGKYVARDIGFRGMVVHTEPDGTNALYIGGVTADEYIPEIADAHPPRILRTTDGATFAPVNGAATAIDTPVGRQRPMGYRAMTSYQGRLFVSATAELTGAGSIVEVKDPAGPAPQFIQLTPPSMSVFEMTTFADRLYVGAADTERGYSVWRTNATADSGQFQPVVTDGAGRGATIDSVVSMQVFRGKLYVGASGWYGALFPSSELIRIDSHDRWDLVVGNGRRAADGTQKEPISGLPDGFGNIFNAHFWRQAVSKGMLTVGTNDWSYVFRNFPLVDAWLRPQYGFDAYSTCDGQYWWPSTTNGFGDGLYNYGLRTIVPDQAGFMIGTANHVEGTSVWKLSTPSACRSAEGTGNPYARLSASPPARLTAQSSRCGASLAWDPTPAAPEYTVLRATYETHSGVAVSPPGRLQGGFRTEGPPTAVSAAPGAGNVSVPGPSVAIGTTFGSTFDDSSAQPGERYLYSVMASTGDAGRQPSNTAPVTRPTTIEDVHSAATELAQRPDVDQRLRADASVVAKAADDAGVLQGSQQIRAAARSLGTAAEQFVDYDDLLMRFERAGAAAARGCDR